MSGTILGTGKAAENLTGKKVFLHRAYKSSRGYGQYSDTQNMVYQIVISAMKKNKAENNNREW